ncbi:TPA: four helix bundle protein [Candidatus Acetothermia bacterium]|nr:four helix bundle protein [Candidatus Acetothermia bacterium]
MGDNSLEKAKELQARTKTFALRIIRMFRRLPKTEEAKIMGRQVLRSGTSVAANYRAVCRARSKAEFAAKLGVVVEEADETVFWLELLVESGIVPEERARGLIDEAKELLAIFVVSRRTARKKSGDRKIE